MSATWPGTLPQKPMQSGYRDSEADNILESSMDGGPAKRRMRYTSAPRIISFQMRFTAAQVATFQTFFRSTTHYGCDSFLFSLPPAYGAAVLVHFKAHNVPAYIPEGDQAVYTIMIEVDP